MVETPVTAADGDTIADVAYFDSLSGERAILEASVVTGIRNLTGPDLARGDRQCHGAAAIFLKDVFARAKVAGKFQMTQQQDIKYT